MVGGVMGNLSSRVSLDFVVDCGADPTGSIDCVPALNKAFALLSALCAANNDLPLQSCELFVPPGLFSAQSIPTPWIFSGPGFAPTSVRVTGVKDASIFEWLTDPLGLSGQWQISGPQFVEFDHITIFGGQTAAPPGGPWDCSACLELVAAQQTNLHDCRILGIFASTYVIQLTSGLGNICERNDISGCACDDAIAGTVLLVYNHLFLRDCQMEDNPQCNGVPFAQTAKSSSNQRHMTIHLDLVPGDSYRKSVDIEGLILGTSCLNGSISVIGSAAHPTAYVSIRNVEGVLPTIAYTPGVPYLSCSDINNLEIDGFRMDAQGLGSLAVTFPGIGLTRVVTTRITALFDPTLNAATCGNYVTADAACGLVEFNGGLQNVSLIQTSAQQTTIKSPMVANDLAAIGDVESSGSALTSFQVVKPSSAGVVPLGTADPVTISMGVTLDTASGAGVPVRVARSGQPVTMISDGTAPVAVGDPIGPSTTVAGDVKTSAGGGLGVALTAAVAVPGTLFIVKGKF
jgi:hypothetical protein